MAERSSRPRLRAVPGPDAPGYAVGYGKPPKHTRFKPGQSGNPRGRPKGSRNRLPAAHEERLKTVVLEEAYRMLGVRDGDRLVEIPTIQAIIRSVALNAAKGQQRSQRMFTDLLQWVEGEGKALQDQLLETAIQYKTDWELELRHRERTGATGPEPIPHPDDIIVDLRSGRVDFRGPMTREEKQVWDEIRQDKRDCDARIAKLEKRAARDPDNRDIRRDLELERRLRAKFVQFVPD